MSVPGASHGLVASSSGGTAVIDGLVADEVGVSSTSGGQEIALLAEIEVASAGLSLIESEILRVAIDNKVL